MENKPPFGNVRTMIYAEIFGHLQQCARDNGYALAVHGSCARDFDIIAVPWTDKAVEDSELIYEFVRVLHPVATAAPVIKPHGRKAWFIILSHEQSANGLTDFGVDVSVMPRLKQQDHKQEAAEEMYGALQHSTDHMRSMFKHLPPYGLDRYNPSWRDAYHQIDKNEELLKKARRE